MADFAYQLLFAGEAAGDELYDDVLELTVETRGADPSTVRLKLATTLDEDGDWTHLGDDRWALFAPLTIRLGYLAGEGLAGALSGALGGGGGNDGLVTLFTGYVSGVELSLGSEPGQTVLTVMAVDPSLLLGLEEKVAVWSNVTDSDVIEQIAGSYGLDTDVEATATTHEENETVLVQRSTDLQFLRTLARRNGFEFAFEPDPDSGDPVAHCTAPQLDDTPQPDLAIQFGEESNLARFGVTVDGRRPLNVKVTQTDMHAKSANTAQVTSISLTELGADDLDALAGDAIDRLATPQDAASQLLLLGPPTSDTTELQALAQAARDEAGWFMTATGEVNCDAYGAVLRPRRTVLVKGAGDLYSGTWYVTRVTHTITSDGRYRQTFDAKRNARGLTGNEPFGGDGLSLPLPGL